MVFSRKVGEGAVILNFLSILEVDKNLTSASFLLKKFL